MHQSNIRRNSKDFPLYFKFLSLLSVVRGYNIFIVVIAQYLAAIFIFSPQKSLRYVMLDLQLYFTVLATICVIAAGYIINNFYDSETDLINRPIKSKLDRIVSQATKLKIYFFLNFLGVLIAYLVSWRAALFFSVYIFLIWFYSHKLKRFPLVGLIIGAVLSITPFFAIFVFYKNFSEVIFIHAAFLFFILLIRELIKDLENLKGDLALNYGTIPVKYGEYFTKLLVTLLVFLTINPIYFIFKYPEIGMMRYYFYGVLGVLLIFIFILWKANQKKHYILLHNVLKLLILAGILSLTLVDTSVIIEKLLTL